MHAINLMSYTKVTLRLCILTNQSTTEKSVCETSIDIMCENFRRHVVDVCVLPMESLKASMRCETCRHHTLILCFKFICVFSLTCTILVREWQLIAPYTTLPPILWQLEHCKSSYNKPRESRRPCKVNLATSISIQLPNSSKVVAQLARLQPMLPVAKHVLATKLSIRSCDRSSPSRATKKIVMSNPWETRCHFCFFSLL